MTAGDEHGAELAALAVVEDAGPVPALAAIAAPPPVVSLVDWMKEAEAAAAIARQLAPTAFVPSSLRIFDPKEGFDLEGTVAQVTAAILTGHELGLGIMAALRSIDVIPPGTGNPAIRAAALRGILLHRGHDIWVAESTATRALVRGQRAGTDIVQQSLWTIDRAKRLKSFSKADSNWQTDPTSQLVARATGEVSRWIAADALLGLPYIVEEFADELDDAPPKRKRATRPRVRPGPSTSGDAPADPPPDPSKVPLSRGQQTRLWQAMKRAGITGHDESLEAVGRWIGRPIGSSNELTAKEADDALAEAARIIAANARAAARGVDDVPLPPPPDSEPPR